MNKYLVLYKAPADLMPQTGEVDPEEAQKGMEQWMAWASKCGENLLDLGQPLAWGLKLQSGGSSEKSKLELTGFSILQAENMEEAKALLENHPHLGWNEACSLEVHEAAPLPGS